MVSSLHTLPKVRRMRGFTLLELLVTLAVAAILATVAVPSFTNFISNQKIKASSHGMYSGLLLARAEAIKRNTGVTIKPLDDTDWSKGWKIVHGTEIIRQQELDGIAVTTTATALEFTNVGRLEADADFTFCDAASRPGTTPRQISLGTNGRPSLSLAQDCSS